MKKLRRHNTPARVSDLTFADFDDTKETWEQKAQDLQARRWQALKRAMKGDDHASR